MSVFFIMNPLPHLNVNQPPALFHNAPFYRIVGTGMIVRTGTQAHIQLQNLGAQLVPYFPTYKNRTTQ